MVETYGPSFMHIHLITNLEVQQKRAVDRNAEDIAINRVTSHPVEKQINQLEKIAHHTIVNNGTTTELFQQIDKALEKDIQCR